MTLLILSWLAAAVIFSNGLFTVVNRMSCETSHGMRIAWIAMTTGALGVLLSPIFAVRTPTCWEAALLLGMAGHIYFERRLRRYPWGTCGEEDHW